MSTTPMAVEAQKLRYFTWMRAKRLVGFVLLFILSTNLYNYLEPRLDVYNPGESFGVIISNASSTIYHAAAPYLEIPVDILLWLMAMLSMVLTGFGIVAGLFGIFWTIFNLKTPSKKPT